MSDVFARPLPKLGGLTGEFYAFTKQHELHFQRCTRCDRWRHVPRVLCPDCASDTWEWARSTGQGTVFTWSITHRPMHPAFLEMPYATVVVELVEGPRMLTTLVDVAPEELRVGMPVEVVFDDVTDVVTLPRFRRRA
jgi:uncharacterized OB-fold protein